MPRQNAFQEVFQNLYLSNFIYTFLPKELKVKNGNGSDVYFFGKKVYLRGIQTWKVELDSFLYVSRYLSSSFLNKYKNNLQKFLNGIELYPKGWLVENPWLIAWFAQLSYAKPPFLKLLDDNDVEYCRKGFTLHLKK